MAATWLMACRSVAATPAPHGRASSIKSPTTRLTTTMNTKLRSSTFTCEVAEKPCSTTTWAWWTPLGEECCQFSSYRYSLSILGIHYKTLLICCFRRVLYGIYVLDVIWRSLLIEVFSTVTPLWQGSVLVSLRFLQTSMEAVAGNENTEIETEGYLLEKGVKETIMEYTDPVLKFLLLKNQVEEGTSGTAPADAPATT